jgi:predicted nucleotidyltransferase
MIQKSNREKLLALFFDSPTKAFQLREMSKLTKIAYPSVRVYTHTFVKEGLIKKEKGNVFPYFIANRENIFFKILKLNYLRFYLEENGLIDELEKTYPDCIVLFGSASRGEDIEKSDIDIFIQGEEVEIDQERFEKKLKRKINLMFENKINNLPNELINNIANGLLLRGYLKVI